MKNNEVKKTAYIPALRVSEPLANRVWRATERLGIDLPALRRMICEDFARIAEEGRHLSSPPRLMTGREDIFIKECLKVCGMNSVDEFFTESVSALKAANKNGHKIERPLRFTEEVGHD